MSYKKKLSILSLNMYYGGAQRVISILLNELVKDYDVSLVLFYNQINFDIPEEVSVVILFPSSNKKNTLFRKVKNTLMVSAKYNRFIRQNDIDISMSFLALPNIINGMVKRKNKSLKTIISERCFPSVMYKANKSSQLLSKFVIPKYYNKNDILFSNSIYINEDLKFNFGVDLPMKVIYNPIEIDEKASSMDTRYNKDQALKLICVGSIYDAKNQSMIVHAMALLKENDYHYTQAGSGILEDKLKDLSKEKGLLGNITFLGNINNVREHLLENDCFVLPSKTEGFPNVVLEALSVGLPVISTHCRTGPLELLNDNEKIDIPLGEFAVAKYGLMVNVNDYQGLAKALKYFKENPEVRQKFSEEGVKRAREFTLPKIYNQIKQLIEA